MALVQLVNYASAFAVLVLLTHVLSVKTYGVVAFSVGIVQVLSIVLDLGLTLSVTQKISVHRDRRKVIARLVGATLTLKIAAFMLGAVLVGLYAAETTKYANYAGFLLLTLFPLLGHAVQPIWFFSGIERMKFLTAFIVVAKLSFVLIVWLTVREEANYYWVLVADGIAQVLAAIVGIALIYQVGYRILRPRWREIRYTVKMTSGFFVSRLAATAYSYSGVVVLGLAADPSSVAFYALAEQLYRAMHAAFSPIVQSLYPYMARAKDFRLMAQIAVASTVVAAVGALAGHFVAPHLLPIMFGTKWISATPILDIFLVAIVVHVLAMMSGYPLASAVGRIDVVNSAVTYGALIYVVAVCALLFLHAVTPRALAWLLVASELYVLLHCASILWIEANRQHRLRTRPTCK